MIKWCEIKNASDKNAKTFAEIKARHESQQSECNHAKRHWDSCYICLKCELRIEEDRAWLIAEVERLTDLLLTK